MKNYNAPSSAAKFILFQRTGYIKFARGRLPIIIARKLIPFFTYNRSIKLEAKIRSESIIDRYFSDMRKEYESIQTFLPAHCKKVLDIGCGIAGVDVFINEHYFPKRVEFYLLDKSKVEKKVYYNFESKGAFYNSLDLANATLIENGIPNDNVHLVEATRNNHINIKDKVDLALSLLSWGFHYPVSTYLDKVYTLLNERGVLILDIRKGTDGLDLVTKKFGNYTTISEAPRFVRISAIK